MDEPDRPTAGDAVSSAAPQTALKTEAMPDQTAARTPDERGLTEALVGANWPATVADAIEGAVGSVHDKVVRPLLIAARAVVFGIVIATMGLVLAVLLSVALIRLLTVYVFDGRVWASYALVGALFCGAGFLAWRMRSRAAKEAG